ncbi:hypothetical protein SDC9_75668 [bioreactor metagenome]|uniref:Uncharacterized protein n=1 Tax=bioreactor metagenome TaxID=1076179 RepID=A0A644YLC5_9ZZZZ
MQTLNVIWLVLFDADAAADRVEAIARAAVPNYNHLVAQRSGERAAQSAADAVQLGGKSCGFGELQRYIAADAVRADLLRNVRAGNAGVSADVLGLNVVERAAEPDIAAYGVDVHLIGDAVFRNDSSARRSEIESAASQVERFDSAGDGVDVHIRSVRSVNGNLGGDDVDDQTVERAEHGSGNRNDKRFAGHVVIRVVEPVEYVFQIRAILNAELAAAGERIAHFLRVSKRPVRRFIEGDLVAFADADVNAARDPVNLNLADARSGDRFGIRNDFRAVVDGALVIGPVVERESAPVAAPAEPLKQVLAAQRHHEECREHCRNNQSYNNSDNSTCTHMCFPPYFLSMKAPRIIEDTAAAIKKMIQVMCQAPVAKLTTM